MTISPSHVTVLLYRQVLYRQYKDYAFYGSASELHISSQLRVYRAITSTGLKGFVI